MHRLYVGYTTGPFGLKGEVKIKSDETHTEKIFKVGNYLYIDDNKYKISTYRMQKETHIISFEGLNDINKIDNLLKKDIFIDKDELDFASNEYLNIELIGLSIIDNAKTLGIVEELLYNKNNLFIKSGNLIIPLISKYVDRIDLEKKIIYVKESSDLIL